MKDAKGSQECEQKQQNCLLDSCQKKKKNDVK